MFKSSITKKALVVAAIAFVAFSVSGLMADNLLQNPGFESWTGGTPDNWSNDNGITVEQCDVADSVHGGSYSARITLTTQSQGNADFYSDEVPVTAGTQYVVSFWIYDNDPAGKGRLVVWWYDSNHSSLSNTYTNLYSSDSPDWQQLIDTLTAPDNAAYAKLVIRFYDVASNWDGDALFHVDDAAFEGPSGNQPPSISNVQQSPTSPTSSDDVTVTADITDPDGNLTKDSLYYRVKHDGSWGDWSPVASSKETKTYTIPAQANHDSVQYYIIAEDDQGARSQTDTYAYYVSDDPVISNVQQSPAAPTSSDDVTVTADITDPNGDLATDSLFYSTDGGNSYTQVYHTSVNNDTYTYQIPHQNDGTTVQYYIMAKDNAGNRTTSDTYSYTVADVYPLVINEIMYNPPTDFGSDTHCEWVEIYNPNDDEYDVSNWVVTDGEDDFTIPNNISIPAFGFLVVAKDTDTLRALSDYSDDLGSSNDLLVGNAIWNLSNSGDQVVLKNADGATVDSVNYDDSSPWPTQPDGNGPSLELTDPSSDNNDGNNWAASSEEYGTPGEPNSTYNNENVVHNSDFEVWGASGPSDWEVDETGVTVSAETSIRRRGNKSAKLVNSLAGNGLWQAFSVQQNADYDLRVWVYPVGASDNIRVFMIFMDASDNVVDSIGPLTASQTDKWQLIRRRDNVPAATRLYLRIRGYNESKGTSGYVDDVYFQSPGALSVGEGNVAPSVPHISLRTLTSSDRVEFVVPTERPVEVTIYSVDGRRHITLRGKWRLVLPTTGMRSGVYFAVAKSDGKTIGKTRFVVVH